MSEMDDLPDRRYRPCVLCDQLIEQVRRPGTPTYRPWICDACYAEQRTP